MSDSGGQSRRGIIAGIGVLVIGAARFGEDFLRVLPQIGRVLRGIIHSETPLQQENTSDSESVDDSESTGDSEINESYVPIEERRSSDLTDIIYNVDTDEELELNHYIYRDFDFTEFEQDTTRLDYEVIVREGPEIDVFILEEEEFEAYENNYNFVYLRSSDTGTRRATGRAFLGRKKYYVVFDNTDAGPTSPDDYRMSDARISVEITIE